MTARTVERLRLMIVAGEDSGDAHAASLVRALRESAPETAFEFFGSTGERMRAAGVESVIREDDLAITGLLEIARALPHFVNAYRALKRAARTRRPDAVILVDWPDFNLALARTLKRRGCKIIYYISPQLWAWRAHRVRQVRRDVDLLLAILPFEKAWYTARGFKKVEFVGHPLAGTVRPRYGRAEFCARHDLDAAQPIIALLPGSRRKELQRILPVMLDAAARLRQAHAGAQFVLALGSSRPPADAEQFINAACLKTPTLKRNLRVTQHETREVLAASDVAAVASGTATLEAALVAVPLVVVYRESALNWHTLGRLIQVEHFGLVNLIAGERLAPELLQNDFTGERLARELAILLEPECNAAVRKSLRVATAQLGEGGASARAAESVLRSVRIWKKEGRTEAAELDGELK